MDFDQATPSALHWYLGIRLLCWDIAHPRHGILQAALQDSSRVIALLELGLISRVSTDPELHGTTTQISNYEPTSACPTIMQGIDSLDDLHFHYDLRASLGGTGNQQVPGGTTRILPQFTETKRHSNRAWISSHADEYLLPAPISCSSPQKMPQTRGSAAMGLLGQISRRQMAGNQNKGIRAHPIRWHNTTCRCLHNVLGTVSLYELQIIALRAIYITISPNTKGQPYNSCQP